MYLNQQYRLDDITYISNNFKKNLLHIISHHVTEKVYILEKLIFFDIIQIWHGG